MFYSPLRYPGGKNKLAKFIAQICIDNNIDGHYIEPYAGGASVALYLLIEKKVKKITINDFDRSIYAFWYSVLNHTKELCILINSTNINYENWLKQKEIQKNKKTARLLDLGFSTLFLNRTNISGIINAGMIGGIEQKGKYKIDCRFNKKAIIERIKLIANFRKQITLENLDAIELIKKIQKSLSNTNGIFYFDPPYYNKGSSLYMNSYKHKQHVEVSEAIKNIKNMAWIVSYDNTQEIKDIYSWAEDQIVEYSLNHSAYRSKKGGEIIITKNIPTIPNIFNFVKS